MKILQIGYPKSGNFWLYRILQQLLETIGHNTKSFIQQHPVHSLAKTWELNFPNQADIDVIDITDLQTTYRISSIFKMPVENWETYLQKTNHVWTHSPVCKRTEGIFSLFDRKVYIIRDPRDVLLSASRYFCSDYMLKYFPQEETEPQAFLEKNFKELLQQWVWHVWDHLRLQKKSNIHICYFEGFLNDFQREFDLLLDYLQLELNFEERTKLEEAVSFSHLQKKNPKHLKKGSHGQWTEGLTAGQKEKAETITGPLLDYLGYGRENMEEKFNFRRSFSSEDAEKLKKEIIASQEILFS
ncbi:aryl sulfotransferase [Salinimicrobium sediminis]|uniref:Aryl sulfotransferase n=1 Tax=Salinimicrobium sediminis TaxID=1343891 RepID=A0A285X3L2_9FLAO|nr:sulfotransferase domain-containing protein [Salinimicrobium sediminis]SOC79905.1 aryl sulfotransferase [Salinimicrobium sediminis]